MKACKQRLIGGISSIYWALVILLFPITWIFPMVTAALIHEGGHYLMLRCFKKRIHTVKVGINGALLETRDLSPGQEFLCALSGPAAGLLPLLTMRLFPGVALCGLLQSLFNLLPIYPLDGGRMLSCASEILHIPQIFCRVLSGTVLVALTMLSVYGAIILRLGLSPILLMVMLTYKAIIGKRPYKPITHQV